MIEANNNIRESGVDLGHRGQELTPNPIGLVDRISGLIRSRLAMAVGIVLAAIGAGTACTPASTDGPNKPVGIYGTQTGALDLTNVPSIGPGQPIPWSVPGATYSNYAEINGKKYIFVMNGVSAELEVWGEGEDGGVAYVKCQAVEDCLSANANIQTVQGLIAAGLPYITGELWPGGPPLNMISAGTSGAFQNKDGDNKLLVDSEGGVHQCDIAPNADAVLEATNCAKLEPPMSGDFSMFKKSGEPYALWAKGFFAQRRNLYTGADEVITPLNINWVDQCGLGFEGDLAPFPDKLKGVVASEMLPKENWWDDTECRLVTAKNWQELNDKPIPLDILNAGSTLALVYRPRLAYDYILYSYDNQPWSAPIPAAPENPEPDADNVQPDTIDEPDEVNQPDTSDQETGQEAKDMAQQPAPDTIVIPLDTSDTSPDASPDSSPDSGPASSSDAGADATPDASPDAGSDTSFDANADTGFDTNHDADSDANSDASPDATPDANFDAGGAPDAGQNEVNTNPSEPDVSFSSPETVFGQDSSITKPSTPAKNSDNGGCQAGPASRSSSPETAGLMLAALASLAMSKRKNATSLQR